MSLFCLSIPILDYFNYTYTATDIISNMPDASSITPVAGEPIYIVEPQEPHTHTHTFILFHGLGSNGEKFGTELLDTGVTSSGHKLIELFPGARFVFPTSKRRRSTAFGRSMLTQWFDIVRLEDPSYRKERQLDGLTESAREIRGIIATELQSIKP
jgi:predicted esterase